MDYFQPILLKISYHCISIDLIWFPIPHKFKTFTLYLCLCFWGIRHKLTIKVNMGIIKAYMISALHNIGIFCVEVENISWKKQKTISSQGIYLDHDYIECEQFNWEKKIEKMNSLSLSWSTQNIPMLCRALII
jgi:hypothetical protein